jgi:hypothetical protein
MGVKPFASGKAFESLRDSDFDSCSALAEVIDNSIQADAKNIKITFDLLGKDVIERVLFSDDGKGMNKDILQNCLRMGWSSRYNDRTGIGRFGVGMTLGAIHECRRVEVYSKYIGGDWLYTYLDLDEIERADNAEKDWEIPSPIKKNPSEASFQIKNIPMEHGTIVVWSKYDRNRDKPAILIEELRSWIGRTFRYFIWNEGLSQGEVLRQFPVSIFLNGQEIKAIDPLYVRTEKTAYPEDPKAIEYQEIVFNWPIGDPKIAKQYGADEAPIRIRFSVLPEEWRTTPGSGNRKEMIQRGISNNEGFSFLRHGREVGYDWIPHWGFSSKEIDRWWGCEIHFEPVLDMAFVVKNIKRGAVPNTDLKVALKKKLQATINKTREDVQDFWKKKSTEPDPGVDLPAGVGGHEQSQKIAQVASVPAGKLAADMDTEIEIDKVSLGLSDGKKDEAARWKAIFQSQPFTIGEKGWPGATFVDIHYMGGSDALIYNNRHKFFEIFNIIRSEVKDGINLEFNAERLTTLIDMLLIAYAKAESSMSPSEKMSPNDLIDHLKNNWGHFLKTYLTTWQEEFDNGISE